MKFVNIAIKDHYIFAVDENGVIQVAQLAGGYLSTEWEPLAMQPDNEEDKNHY